MVWHTPSKIQATPTMEIMLLLVLRNQEPGNTIQFRARSMPADLVELHGLAANKGACMQ